MIRLTSLKELNSGVKRDGLIWIIGHLTVEKDQLYINDGPLKYRLYLQLDAAGSQLLNRFGVCLGTIQVFKESIIVSKLMYLNICDVETHYDFYLPLSIIHEPDHDMFDASQENCLLDQGKFVVQVEAKSEILCKGTVDFIIQATIRSNDFSWLPSNLSYQAQKCCVCTVFIIFHGGKFK